MPVTEDYIDELQRRHGDSPELRELRNRYGSVSTASQIEIDPEVVAKKRTSEVFGTIFGLDEPTTIATYDVLAKNMYGENVKPSQVQKMMEQDGFQINPNTDETDVTEYSNSTLERKDSTKTAERQRMEANRQIFNVFRSLQLADDIIFDPENQWFKEKIATKPSAKEGVLYSEPVHKTEDLLDFDTYASLLEKSATIENVEDLRKERKALLARMNNDAFSRNADYYDVQEWSEFSSGSKIQDITLEAAKGLYTALKTIERGAWSTSIAMGMAWNQSSLDAVEEQLKDAKLTPMKAAGKIGYVTRAMSEAIPNFAYNMTVGTAGIFVTEYGNAKQDALNDGATDFESDAIALPVATINTIIEGWQIDKIFKVAGAGKGAKQAVKKMIKDRSYNAFLKSGAKFTGQSIMAAINEGIEGFTQEGVSIAIPGFVIGNYPKDENGRINWSGIMSQMGQSFVGEGLGGLLLGAGGAVYNARNVQNYKHGIAFNLITNEGMESKQALEIATNIVERLRNSEGNPKEIYRQEVGKVKKSDNRAKAAAHIIKRGKEMSDEQYRKIAIDTTGKDSMVDMTYEEGEKFIEALNKTKVEKVELKEGETKEEVTEKDIADEIEAIKNEEFYIPVKGEIAEMQKPAGAAPTEPIAAPSEAVAGQTQAEAGATPAIQLKDGTITTGINHGEIYTLLKSEGKLDTNKTFTEQATDGWVKDGKFYNTNEIIKTIGKEKYKQLSISEAIKEYEALAEAPAEAKVVPKEAVKKEGKRGGFINNTPFGNKDKLQKRVDEIVELAPTPKKPFKEEGRKRLKDLKKTDTLTTFVNVATDAINGIDRAFGIMSTRIKNISPKLFQEVRNKYINPVKMVIADRTQKVHPFVDAISKFNEQDVYDWEVARWMGDIDTIDRLIEKHGLQEAYDKYRLVFDLMYHEGKAVGMDMNYMTAYFPSKVKDLDGLLKELNNREEYAPIVKALAASQDKKGRQLSKEEQIQILDTLLRGYRTTGVSLTPPGFTKARTLIRDDIGLIRYYYGFAETTSRYIESMTENIQARKFFGKQTKEIVQLRANISRQKTNIAKWEKDTEKDRTKNIQTAKDKLQEYETKLIELDDGALNASIGSYVLDLIEDGTINYDQQVELRQIFDGLFNTVGSNRWVHTLRSLEYVGSLAQVPALVTQYSEVILSILKAPGTTLPNWVRAHLNKSKIKLEDIGVAHIGQEWADADLNNTMTSLMKAFEKVDKIGKETFINSVIDKYRKMAKTNPDKVKQELSKYYIESEHDAIITSLKSGAVDNNIKGFALNELADVQPISKMEVPELYAKAGNLRVFYMYKTFTLKRLDIMRNQAYNEIKEGVKTGSRSRVLKGLSKLVWLAIMFTLADSSADVVKDVIRGKPIQGVPDYVVDNLLQMILLSKYSANKVPSQGLSAFFRDNIALPVSTLDAATKDVSTLIDEDSEKGSELTKRIPWIGDLYYWYFGEGARKVEEGYYN